MNNTQIKNKANNSNTPYFYLSKYRGVIMGIMILWVIIFHSSFTFNSGVPFIDKTLNFIKDIGYGGVDVFFLLGGMGIYNSLEKNDLGTFYKNRLIKILPTWFIYLFVLMMVSSYVYFSPYTGGEVFGFVTFTGFWMNFAGQGNWYIHATMLFYFIAVYIHFFMKKSNRKILLVSLIALVSIVFAMRLTNDYRLIAFSRFPVFLLGMTISATLRDKLVMDKKRWFILLAIFIASVGLLILIYTCLSDYMWEYGLHWYAFLLIAPTMSLLIAKAFDMGKKYLKWLIKFLSILGKSSLEILLISDFFNAFFKKMNIVYGNDVYTSLFIIGVAIVGGIALRYLIDLVTNLLKKIKLPNKELKKMPQ